MEPTLLVLAAGMASRYGSLKQIDKFGPSGESIIDYSIYDAIKAGYKKVVFIIRESFANEFKEIFGTKLNGKIEVDYVFQESHLFIGDFSIPAERLKPWGTAHAILCAKEKVDTPFAVINADDYYGQDSFVKSYDFLKQKCNEHYYGLIGYQLRKTLSEHGTVSRGICEINAGNELISIIERTKVYKNNDRIFYEEAGEINAIQEPSYASMNFWCFHHSIFSIIEMQFASFLKENGSDLKSEFFIPSVADRFIKQNLGKIVLMPTSSEWFGVTYKEDAPLVRAKVSELVSRGIYPNKLW